MPVSKGYRRKTRSLLRKRKALTGLSAYLRVYNVGDKVTIVIDPTQPKGMPHRRFQGLVGNVTKVLRRVLEINVKVGNKDRTVIARVEHVKPLVG
ncbi:MAG: 50S ribosomal protein L21 [Thaumarchaeota archaeon]|nr:50S ribosomal protein L21 [Nitrososphaerota archaeon]